jgi:dCMP deaminase
MQLTDEQLMEIAGMVKKHKDCMSTGVGAVLLLPNGSALFGANQAPSGQTKCVDGGCYRCANRDREEFKGGRGYDVCTCVHAEEDCIVQAAKRGIAIEGATLYCTRRPCRGCTKQLLHVGIFAVYYEDDLLPEDPDQLEAYLKLQAGFPGGVHQLLQNAVELPIVDEIRVGVPLK